MCSTESFCHVAPGVSFTAALSPVASTIRRRSARRGSSRCRHRLLLQVHRYAWLQRPRNQPGDVSGRFATIINHYGGAVLRASIEAASSAYPQRFDYRLTLSSAHGATGEDVYTDLAIVAGLRITTAPRLPEAKVGHTYDVALHATGGVPTMTGPARLCCTMTGRCLAAAFLLG